jgi:phage tail-like protein
MNPPRPFTAFNFSVEIYPNGKSAPLVSAAFAECDGLEMTIDVKTIRSGGASDHAFRVPGFVNYSNLTLKRGMTGNFDLWSWFEDSIANPYLRADAEIVLLGEDGGTERARFQLRRCLPVKVKAPALHAKDGQVAIEELQLAYEKLQLVRPAPKAAA